MRLPDSGCCATSNLGRLCSTACEARPLAWIQFIVNRLHSPHTAIPDPDFHLVFTRNSFSRFTKLSEFSDKTLQNHFHLGNIHSNGSGLPPWAVVRNDTHESNDFQCSRFRKWTHDGRRRRTQRHQEAKVQQSLSIWRERQTSNVFEAEFGRSSGEQCGGNDLQELTCRSCTRFRISRSIRPSITVTR